MTAPRAGQGRGSGLSGGPAAVPQLRTSFEREIASAERAELRVALKLLLALAVVALLIGARLWFF